MAKLEALMAAIESGVDTLKAMSPGEANGMCSWQRGYELGEYEYTWDYFGLGALHVACFTNNAKAVEELLKVDEIDVNQTIEYLGDKPEYQENKNILNSLFFTIQNVPPHDSEDEKEMGKYIGYTPLMIAAVKKYTDIFTLLVKDDRVDLKASVVRDGKIRGLNELLEVGGFWNRKLNYHMRVHWLAATKTDKVGALRDLSSDLGELLESGDMCDFKIVCEGEEILCHKFVLMARSNVLRTMINNGMRESVEDCMEIADLDPEIVKIFVKFIYTGKVAPEDLKMNATKLLEVADRYELKSLAQICENELVFAVNNDNVLAMAMKADMYNAKELREFCVKWVKENSRAVVKPEGWRRNVERFPNIMVDIMEALIS